jgi:acyl-CoA synthetase (AMP-forming)/AMP-acid ligase II
MSGHDPHDLLRRHGDRPAIVMAGSGRAVTYAELDDRSTRLARAFDDAGLEPGDHVALMLGNQPEFFDVVWAAFRAGLYVTPINWHLGTDEAAYIIEDCGAKAFVTSADLAPVAAQLVSRHSAVAMRLMTGGPIDGYDDFEATLAAASPAPRADERAGALMVYSSGTTGYPKGIVRPLPSAPFGATTDAITVLMSHRYRADETSVYLTPAPLYHSAPVGFSSAVQRIGATVVVMERFDAEAALRTIEEHAVTHAQFVPTHFIRMLHLPDEVRARYDLSSLDCVIHAAAPCPVPTKQRMIEWLGPIVEEYYAGSEAVGVTLISSQEWLEHPGSVGRPAGDVVHILDVDGRELPAGETGHVWFEATSRFVYNNDPAKTRDAQDDRGWATYGDIGHLDDAGYLYLTDRASNMIISGGVNIYPQEAEMVLSAHPAVHDVAVLGVPDADMGEVVQAFVQLRPDVDESDETATELIAFCRERLAHFKCPRRVAFVAELPRLDSGKLLKRKLLDQMPPH